MGRQVDARRCENPIMHERRAQLQLAKQRWVS
jgi:hypothetical protein